MSFETDIFERIKDMDEMESKKTLALIFTKYMKINKNGYTKEDCFKDVEEIYRAFVVDGMFK
ncbi:hypothetical protein J7E81_15545 [Bacillus sp. ISL-18]|uniref:hypothetical protein n=1 Tax=Bacillus sp. ISL-18 TaxID=2819118 RepID=UPI001BE63D86|nr:hypothetical protein [Bacillus sp. ISL-18]MBT2656633.1 hypothetical protein [Bacillus sp. ISL-18]